MEQYGVVPTVSLGSVDDYLAVTEALVAGGLPIIEVLLRAKPNELMRVKLDAILEIRKKFGDEVLVGSGTTQQAGHAQAAIDNGAQFVVSNLVSEDVVRTAHRNGVFVLPAIRTDTEVFNAMNLGCNVLKVILPHPLEEKVPFFRWFVNLFPRTSFMASSGVTVNVVGDLLKAGALFVAAGQAKDELIPPGAVEEKQWHKIGEATKKYLEVIKSVRRS